MGMQGQTGRRASIQALGNLWHHRGQEDAIQAQRDHSLGITGMLLYDGGRYQQTLEGPPAALDHIWSTIQHDPRRVGCVVNQELRVTYKLVRRSEKSV